MYFTERTEARADLDLLCQVHCIHLHLHVISFTRDTIKRKCVRVRSTTSAHTVQHRISRRKAGSEIDRCINCGSIGSGGGQLTPLFQVGSKNTVWPPLLTCTKHVFAAFGSLSCTINAIHSVHDTHLKLSLAYPTLAEHNGVLILAFH